MYRPTSPLQLQDQRNVLGATSISLLTKSSTTDERTEPQRVVFRRQRIAVIGGGASGMFAATAAADAIQKYLSSTDLGKGKNNFETEAAFAQFSGCDVVVFEGTSRTLSKVRISGGGRCNVLHDTTKSLPQILSSYPRGNKELRGLYTKRFTPDDAYKWFTSRGVQLKTESDGRMFPISDDSRTIIDAISSAAIKSGVKIRTKEKVESIVSDQENGSGKFHVELSSKPSSSPDNIRSVEHFDAIVLATGSFPIGHELARSLGHTIINPVPSLFTFDAKELVKEGGLFHGLAGVSVPWARLTLTLEDTTPVPSKVEATKVDGAKKKRNRKKNSTTFTQEGPLLITHHGISGPATLRLSAFAAREFHKLGYHCLIKIHFCPQWEEEQRLLYGMNGSSEHILMDALWETTRMVPKRQVSTGCPLFLKGVVDTSEDSDPTSSPTAIAPIIPKRLWSALVHLSQIPSSLTWGDASKSMIRALSRNISSFSLQVTSKGVFKEEFVTAGGVSLKEVHMTNMESKVTPGLFLCGEVLDVDGVTGGFNFMGCWSTGFVAGEGAANFCCCSIDKDFVSVQHFK